MIDEVVVGQSPTLLHASKANEVIKAINALLAMTVSPAGSGKLTVSDGNVVLDLSALIGNLASVDTIIEVDGYPYAFKAVGVLGDAL